MLGAPVSDAGPDLLMDARTKLAFFVMKHIPAGWCEPTVLFMARTVVPRQP